MAGKTRMAALAFAGIVLAALAPLSASYGTETSAIDSQKVTITLERSACLGSCPVYKVTIHGDGRVLFTTKTAPVDPADAVHRRFAYLDGVLIPGTHKDQVSPGSVAALVKQFEAADFWHLKKVYSYPATDNPTQIITLVLGSRRKTVIDYIGTKAGMPRSVRDLENAIDGVAGTDRWVVGSPALIPWLERTGFDFHSDHAVELAVAGEQGSASESTVGTLIDRGAPLNQPVTIGSGIYSQPGSTFNSAGIELIKGAMSRGHAEVFKRLVAGGWLDRLGRAKAAELFAEDAAGCSPDLVDAVAEAGVDIDRPASRETDADPDDPQGQTALAKLATSSTCEDNETVRVKTAEKLLVQGANPNSRDSAGRTPLYGIENLDLLNLLLVHGADATVKSNDGQSMIFGSWTDAIVLRLLKAGASPIGRYDFDGKTLVQEAKDRNMPQVAQWLAAHPEAFQR